MAKKRYCKKCNRKLKRNETNLCLDCLLKEMGQQEISFDLEKIKEKIWQEIKEQQKENKIEE